MRKIFTGLLLWGALTTAAGAGVPSWLQMRGESTSDPNGLIVTLRAALDAGAYARNPAGERDALWWMGHAGINASDGAAVTEAVARLQAIGSVGHDKLAKSYAGFLAADQRVVNGDMGGVSDALQAAELQLSSPHPAHRALAKFQLCDVYDMAFQFRQSQPLCEQADAAFGALHDDWDQAQAKNDEGNNAYGLGQYASAGLFYAAARALYLKTGDRAQYLMTGDNLAQVYLKQHKPAQALQLSRASLANETAAGRKSDALISQYDIARALEALGKRREAAALLAKTVAQTRALHFDAALPDLLVEQASMAERNGDLKLALAAQREALKVSRARWSVGLSSQQAELSTRYAAREKEIRIQELERNNQIRKLKLKAADAEAARNAMRLRRQRTTAIASVLAAFGMLVGVISLLLLLRLQRRHTRELRRQALEDPLTGVGNRRGFFERVDALLVRRDAVATPLHALLLLDFDHFKTINDHAGHPFGDVVLNVSLQRLREVVADRGYIARLGGEEFVVLYPRAGGVNALQLAEAMRRAVAALAFSNAPEGLEVTVSIGVALYDGSRCHDVASWLRSVDEAMYSAKARGRDQIVVAHVVEQLLSQVGADPAPSA